MPAKYSRREFIKWGGAGIGAALTAVLVNRKALFESLLPPMDQPLGHRLWDKKFPPISEQREVDLVIVGGGMSALSAAWYLAKHFPHFKYEIHEVESEVGGNSAWGQNEISEYPWGAHYVPFANEESDHVREIFRDLGVITNSSGAKPFYNEDYVCHDAEERLLYRGKWSEGLVPHAGMSIEEENDFKKFFEIVDSYKHKKGSDGKHLFCIPLELSSHDESARALDKKSFSEFLDEKQLNTPALRWYLDYCCKDDFGALAKDVSAWAGIHYFAARRGEAANGGNASLVTWPAGNGWLAQELKKRIKGSVYNRSLVYEISNQPESARVFAYDAVKDISTEIKAKAVILATPLYVSSKIFSELEKPWAENKKYFHHSPWLIANVTLDKQPEGDGFPLAWDNVSFYSDSIGYVVATHQRSSRGGDCVITFYHPFTEVNSSYMRHRLLLASQSEFENQVRRELRSMHPEIEKSIRSITTKIWGHGMIRPSKNFMWSGVREEFSKTFGRVHLAHTDLSGISLFEEASYQGIKAVKNVKKFLDS